MLLRTPAPTRTVDLYYDKGDRLWHASLRAYIDGRQIERQAKTRKAAIERVLRTYLWTVTGFRPSNQDVKALRVQTTVVPQADRQTTPTP